VEVVNSTEEQPPVEETSEMELTKEAEKHMKDNNVKKIWRCPKHGYWFTREDSAKQRESKTGVKTECYTL
jgi:hypothetical protein